MLFCAGALLALIIQGPGLPLQSTISRPTAPPPTAAPTRTPAIHDLAITHLGATADDRAGTITFQLQAQTPPERHIAEVLLWYDTETGHRLQRTAGPLSNTIRLDYVLDAAGEGLTTTQTSQLAYWWLVRDSAGETARAGDSVALGPGLQALIVPPTPEPPPLDFTWAISESRHYRFHYVPGSTAERDRFQIGALAEQALTRTTSILDLEFDGTMDVYLVPRVFWQGGAAYGDKVQLISYLDRNYTGVETWSYFTHEGTHALAQDLLQPKEDGGRPDGVLVEGLAVWASSGHYRAEPIDEWTAVLAASDDYIPLADLRAGPFYDFQHEISYLEGASFVKFLIDRYGLDKLKELYGRATSEDGADEALVQELYGQGYAGLERAWLAHLATLAPSPEQADLVNLQIRSFDLMRRYETELDPDARILPGEPPPEWDIETLTAFLRRSGTPANLVLETALIAIQERILRGDTAGASDLLDDVEAALDAGGALERPSLRNRKAIVDLLALQDRAILTAQKDRYQATLDPAYAAGGDHQDLLLRPWLTWQQEVVRLDLSDDGLTAHGVVLLHAGLADGAYTGDGSLFAVAFRKRAGQWLQTRREPLALVAEMPPVLGD